ncbi:MAG: hypothetical protein CL927_14630 [Deltaproteobacteria bacterium]|nr:hypothetical protein [Deltaproteobacteria bacterium]
MSRIPSAPQRVERPVFLHVLVMVSGLVGCSQGSVLTFNKTVDSGIDTAERSPDSGGTGSGEVIEQDPVYDDSGDGGSGSGTEPDPVYTWSAWTGERTYSIDKTDPRETDCTSDTVSEAGIRIETDLERWQDLCRICSDFYEVTYAASRACGGDVDLTSPEVRGFVLRGSELEVWRIRENGTESDIEIEFNDAPYSAGRADFSFDDSWNGEGTVTVTGFIQLDELPSP